MSSLALTVTVLVLVFGVEPRNLRARGASNPQRGAWGTGAAAVLAGVRAMVRDSDFALVDGSSRTGGHDLCHSTTLASLRLGSRVLANGSALSRDGSSLYGVPWLSWPL